MHTTVEDGRATRVTGDPDHPITVGFLCGKVSNYCAGGRSCQATTSQELTAAGNAPIFNDNRVEIEPVRG
jgi:hypothetical protein